MTELSPSILSLSDDDLMLMLCVRAEKLSDPSRWCREMRAYILATNNGPKTSAEADELFATMARLRAEASGE
jgi:hypothetical protein